MFEFRIVLWGDVGQTSRGSDDPGRECSNWQSVKGLYASLPQQFYVSFLIANYTFHHVGCGCTHTVSNILWTPPRWSILDLLLDLEGEGACLPEQL